MTQNIQPNMKSNLDQASVRSWLQAFATGVLEGFDVTPGASGFLLNIASGKVVIEGNTIHDDLTRTNTAMITHNAGFNEHHILYAQYTPQETFPAPAMVLGIVSSAAASPAKPTAPSLPADATKLADIFIASAATTWGPTAQIINAPKLPARGLAGTDVLTDRLVNANLNVIVDGGGAFTYDGALDTLTWTLPIRLMSISVTNLEKYFTAPTVSASIAAGVLGSVGDNAIIFAVFDRRTPNDPSSPTVLTAHVLDLDNPDPTERSLFFNQNTREQIVFISAIVGGNVRFRGGMGSTLPPPVADARKFLRNDPGGVHYWSLITSDLVIDILSISSFQATTAAVEVGIIISAPAPFTASYAQGPPTTASLTKDLLGTPVVQSLTPPATSFNAVNPPASYQKLNTNEFFRFRLTADAGATPDTADADITWRRFFYFGKNVSGAPTINQAFIKALDDAPPGGRVLTAGRAHTFVMTGLVNEFVYFSYPDSHGVLVGLHDNVADFDISFVDMGTVAAVTTENGAGTTTTYRVYRSTFGQTGSINFTTR